MSDYEKRLHEWSRKVVEYCHNIAVNKDYDMDLTFYAFQSMPMESPELLVLGINPAGSYTYSDLYNNPIWGLLEKKRMTADAFVKMNPVYSDHITWKLWKNLSKSFIDEQMYNILEKCVYMNFMYFNTPNLKTFLNKKHGYEVFNKCRDFSLELICDIIKPKNILCLGTANCFDLIPVADTECILKDSKRLLVKGKLNGINIYGMPHPSGSRVSDVNRKKIGEFLKSSFLK